MYETLSLEFGGKIIGLLSSGMCRLEGREKSLNGWLCCKFSGSGSAFVTGEGE